MRRARTNCMRGSAVSTLLTHSGAASAEWRSRWLNVWTLRRTHRTRRRRVAASPLPLVLARAAGVLCRAHYLLFECGTSTRCRRARACRASRCGTRSRRCSATARRHRAAWCTMSTPTRTWDCPSMASRASRSTTARAQWDRAAWRLQVVCRMDARRPRTATKTRSQNT